MSRGVGRSLDLAAIVACAVAWWTAWRTTRDLDWPCESDFYRDLGAAQSFLDGSPGVDPVYLGELWWYNPLVPALVALLSRLSGTELAEAYARFGAHLNLLAPLAFYGMLAVLFQRWVALAGLLGFLFLGQLDFMSWLHATYSPWLWPCNLAQAFFYLGILLLVRAVRAPSRGRVVAAGLGLGLVALAHTAPALLLAVVLAALTAAELRPHELSLRPAWRALSSSATIAGVAALLAAPFWLVVALHYRAQIKNPAPLVWLAGPLELDRWPELVARALSVRGLVAVVGLVGVLRLESGRCQRARRAVLAWAGAAAAGVAYGYVSQRVELPPLLPSWHFYFYLQALESVLFGIGVVTLARLACRWASGSRAPFETAIEACLGFALGALVLIVALRFPEYRKRPDLVQNRREALALGQHATRELYDVVRRRLRPTDVVLADEGVAFMAILPAARKAVALPALFSSPYVDPGPRSRDASTMLAHLRKGRVLEFSLLARRHEVRFVVLPATQRSLVKRRHLPLVRVFSTRNQASGSDLYAVETRTPELAP